MEYDSLQRAGPLTDHFDLADRNSESKQTTKFEVKDDST